jgi:uncharacterized protein YigA (DUF484 family)
MTEHAEVRNPVQAAAEAVKTYIRLHRDQLATDGEMLALLLPARFTDRSVGDLQRHIIEKLREQNAALRGERDSLMGAHERALKLGDAVQERVLELLDARSFQEAIAVAVNAAVAFGADRAAICVEGDGATPKNCDGVRMIAPGTSTALLEQETPSAVLKAGGAALLGPAGKECRSVAIFRVKVSSDTPAVLYVLGAREAGRFEGEEEADLCYFARALERSIRAWLDLPRR